MPWTDQPGPAPQRSEGELYAAVQQRAATIRRRRRTGLSAGLGGAVAALLIGFVLVRAGGDRPSQLRVVGDAVTTTTTRAETPTTVGLLPSTTLTIPPPPETSTTRPGAAVTSTTRTTLPPAPVTTAAPPPTSPSTTTSTEPPPLPVCEPADVLVTATPDRSSYPPGSTVTILVAAQNRSTRGCQPTDPSVQFHDPTGALIGGASVIDRFTMPAPGQPPPSWDPGETLSHSFTWSPSCDGPGCPPGTYTATARFGPFRAPTVSFTLT